MEYGSCASLLAYRAENSALCYSVGTETRTAQDEAPALSLLVFDNRFSIAFGVIDRRMRA